jgi:hypothetical protein
LADKETAFENMFTKDHILVRISDLFSGKVGDKFSNDRLEQIIEKATATNKSVILITDDRKEDWWLECAGRTISPRLELLREFKEKTQNDCYFYKPFQFLTFSNDFLGSDIQVEIIKEVEDSEKQIQSQDREISIEIVVHPLSLKKDFVGFLELLKSTGYQTSSSELNENEFQIVVTLPNIPDLERRFKEKYLSLLHKYDLELLKHKKFYKSLDTETDRLF